MTQPHLLEWARQARCIGRDFLSDFELRFPESRGRLALALRLQLDPEDRPLFQNLLDRFSAAKRVVSYFDWHILLEWNERRAQAFCLAEMRDALRGFRTPGETTGAIVQRLRELIELFRSQILEDSPTLLASVKHRLRFSPLRDEAEYLSQRLRDLRAREAA